MSVPEYTVRITSHRCDRDARRAIIAAICGRDSIGASARPWATTRTRLLYEGVAAVNLIDCDYDALDEKLADHDIIYVDFSKAVPKYECINNAAFEQPRYKYEGGVLSHDGVDLAHAGVVLSYDGVDDQSSCKIQWVEKITTGIPAVVWESTHGQKAKKYTIKQTTAAVPEHHNGHPRARPVRVVHSRHQCAREYNILTLASVHDKLISESTTVNDANAQTNWWKFIDDMFGIKGLQSVGSYLEQYPSRTVPEISAPAAPIRGNAQFNASQTPDAPWPVPEMTINLPPFVKVEEIRHDPAANTIVIRFG